MSQFCDVHHFIRSLRLFLLTASLLLALVSSSGETASLKNHRTQWFKETKWGVFTHYMADTVLKADQLDVANWNRAVDGFDVNALARQLASAGAGYYVITLGQNSGFYCSPNSTYDKLVGIPPGKCSKRDLVADLYEPLHARGIRLMVYLPSGAPDRDAEAMKALEWRNGSKGRLENFQRRWEAVIREWSVRWGDKVSGWWFDGCYYSDAMYRHPEPPNFASFAAAARAGNSNSIVAFNPGVINPIITLTPEEDYTAGEINEPEQVKCEGRWIGGAQFHMLSYLGPTWCQSPPRFKPEQVIQFTRNIVDKGGVVTWDVPIGINGVISDGFMQQLIQLGNAMGTIKGK